ncbi:MAG: ABC transporter permease, partial [Acidimicrobiales bacterium]
MFRTALKGILARKRRLVTTALAVALGVAFMTGTLVLTATIGRTFDNLFADVYKNIDAVVRAQKAFDAPFGEGAQRGMVDASLVDTVRAVDGVKVAEGTVMGFARLVAKDGEPIGNPAMGAPALGGNWTDTKELNPFNLVEGQPPRADNEVVIDKKSATDGKLAVGDTTIALVQGPPQQVRISGIAKFGSVDSPGGASTVLFPTPVAQRLIGEPGKFSSVDSVADEGLSQTELVARIQRVIPTGTEVLTGEEITEESQSEIRQGLSFFSTFLLVFAVVALLVGGFFIYNTFSITVAQRTRENGLLRALGASRRQVLASVILEALVIGIVAALVGMVAGLFVASGLKAMLSGLGFDLPAGGVVFTPGTALTAIVVGVLVTVVASLSPARQAAKVPPIAAMRDATRSSSKYGSKTRVVSGLGLLGLGIGLLFLGLFGSIDNALPVVGLGAVCVFFAVAVLGRTGALPLSRFLGAPLPKLKGATGTLARENAMRNPRRTAASASALMIGVGLVGFITILAASTKESINAAIDRAFTGDFVIDSGSGFVGGLDPSLAAQLNTLPEVDA